MILPRNSPSVTLVDITGGAPELNAEFRYLVTEVSKMGITVIDRCNLTVLQVRQGVGPGSGRLMGELPRLAYATLNVSSNYKQKRSALQAFLNDSISYQFVLNWCFLSILSNCLCVHFNCGKP